MNSPSFGVFGKGLLKNNALLAEFLTSYHGRPAQIQRIYPLISSLDSIDTMLGWGRKKSYQRASRFAKQHGLRMLTLEDGFLRSLDSGKHSRYACSMVIDPIGIYFDAKQPSLLEQIIVEQTLSKAEQQHSGMLLQQIMTERLSKYNSTPKSATLTSLNLDTHTPHILLIDQVAGDQSIKGAGATKKSFANMLKVAKAQHPHAKIWVKAHPAGKLGYLTALSLPSDVQVITDAVNPIELLQAMAAVYTVSSHMGFEALDVASMIAAQSSLPLWGNDLEPNQALTPVQQAPIATNFESIAATPELLAVPGVQQRAVGGVAQVVVTGHISQDTEALLLSQVRGAKKQEQVREQVAQHNALVAAQAAPASRSVPFAPLPTLGYRLDAQAPLWPLEREAVLDAVELDLLTPQAVQLTSFQVAQESDIFEIGMDGARVALRSAGSAQMAMDWESSSIDADTLVGWLDQSLFKAPELAGLTQSQRRAFLAAVVKHQLHSCGVPLVVLAQARFRLARDIESHIAQLRQTAAQRTFRQKVLAQGDGSAWLVEPDWAHPHVFEPGRYPVPVASRYSGRYQFGKHYFPVLADLKDGGQEFQCAQLIDRHPRVRHWVRNLDTAPCGFGLPTSRGRFYADFVAELADGRVALLEFKGLLQHEPYELEKRQVGELWARSSGGKAVFGWLTFEGLAQQLDNALA